MKTMKIKHCSLKALKLHLYRLIKLKPETKIAAHSTSPKLAYFQITTSMQENLQLMTAHLRSDRLISIQIWKQSSGWLTSMQTQWEGLVLTSTAAKRWQAAHSTTRHSKMKKFNKPTSKKKSKSKWCEYLGILHKVTTIQATNRLRLSKKTPMQIRTLIKCLPSWTTKNPQLWLSGNPMTVSTCSAKKQKIMTPKSSQVSRATNNMNGTIQN